jgi:hypothetical protein
MAAADDFTREELEILLILVSQEIEADLFPLSEHRLKELQAKVRRALGLLESQAEDEPMGKPRRR